MSQWRDQKNEQARARLLKAMPPIFPMAVSVHAFGRSLIPPLPRLAVASYWRAHPVRADRLSRALAQRSGAPEGWTWRLSTAPKSGLPMSFRVPPAPYRESALTRGAGHCCVCGQPVFKFGWHRDLWGDGKPNTRARWHACCVEAWRLWLAPTAQAKVLRRLQKRKCPETGTRLLRAAEVDHRTPLFEVWRDHRDVKWPALLAYWGFPNLQAINRASHLSKSAAEAAGRATRRASAAETILT
ncbi:hypothetical protein [Lichenihabitans psoromatis]|uniref:hypothetical protein n=1 Tax=Lichenihabitans psoromatis TaxID=2528642 RepID=UPI0010382E47|nr:hypothetical protein [Lichenihabitans psoromatis]